MKILNLKIKETLLQDALGLINPNERMLTDYIASNAPDAMSREEEIAVIGAEEYEEKNTTVFPKLPDGTPFFWDYQLKGFFKDATSALRRAKGSESSKLKAYKKIIDGDIFVYPRRIPIDLNGGRMSVMQRPLRGSTPQGETVAIASSETVPEGSSYTFGLIVLDETYRKWIEELLDYGQLKGVAQWRNAGWGRFEYEILEEETIDSVKDATEVLKSNRDAIWL